MVITTYSSRAFNQDTSGAKKAALQGPVFITDRGRPAHVLLCMEDYQRLAGAKTSVLEALAPSPEVGLVGFEPQPVQGSIGHVELA